MEYGKVNLSDINSKILQIQLKDGNLELNKIRTEEMNIESKYGKITGKEIENNQSKIESNDGEIELDGDFIGNTEIVSAYGNIDLDLKRNKEYYNLDLTTNDGKIKIDEERIKEKIYTAKEEKLKVNAKDGNITIHFRQ